MKALVVGHQGRAIAAGLEAVDVPADFFAQLRGDTLGVVRAMGGYGLVVVDGLQVPAEAFVPLPGIPRQPWTIMRAGSDLSHIAIDAARCNGVEVRHTAGANAEAVAAFVLEHLPENATHLAVIGYGAIGRIVAREACARGIEKVVVANRTAYPDDGFEFVSTPEEAMRGADAVAIQVAYVSPEAPASTHHWVNSDALAVSAVCRTLPPAALAKVAAELTPAAHEEALAGLDGR